MPAQHDQALALELDQRLADRACPPGGPLRAHRRHWPDSPRCLGEAARLTPTERRTVVETVVASCTPPLVVGISSLALDDVVAESGNVRVPADRLAGLMIQVNRPDSDALGKHLTQVAQSTERPVVVQDYPVVTGIRIATRDLARAVSGVSQVVAVKSESSPSPPAVATLAATLDVPVFGGLGGTCLLDELAGIALGLRKHSLVRRGLIASDAVRTPGAVPPPEMLELLARHLAATPHDDVLAG